MKTSEQNPSKKKPVVRTSVVLPEDLWKATQHRAIETRLSLQQIVIKALQAYLKTPPDGGRKRKHAEEG